MVCIASLLFHDYVLDRFIDFPPIIPAILGPALAFFIGFNNNQAYDRWWEARKIWGAFVNDSRTWARQLICYLSKSEGDNNDDLNVIKKRAIYRHISFLYALKANLRNSEETDFKKYLSNDDIKTFKVNRISIMLF